MREKTIFFVRLNWNKEFPSSQKREAKDESILPKPSQKESRKSPSGSFSKTPNWKKENVNKKKMINE
jgi:hypothetical protein